MRTRPEPFLLYPLAYVAILPVYAGLLALRLPLAAAIMLTVSSLSTTFLALEVVRGTWNRARRTSRVRLDLWYTVMGVLASTLWAAAYVPLGEWLGRVTGLAIRWDGVPMALEWLAAILVMDFLAYWLHRAQHASEDSILWRGHAVHHAVPMLDVVAGAQVHVLDGLISATPLIVVATLGFSPEACGAAFVMNLTTAGLHHTKLKFELGWFNFVTIAPETHRWHHADDRAQTVNYGFAFALWDLAFGTFRYERGTTPAAYGARSVERLPGTLAAHLLAGTTDAAYRRIVKDPVAHPKTLVITGGAAGVGRALAAQASAAGHRVVALDREQQVPLTGVSHLQCDLRDEGAIRSAVETILAQHPHVDVLVNNAVIGSVSPLEHHPRGWIGDAVQVNLAAPLLLTAGLLPTFRQQGAGRVVNVSSLSAGTHVPGTGVYAATKAGLERATSILEAELEGTGVSVGVASLGRTDTEGYRRAAEALGRSLGGGVLEGYEPIEPVLRAILSNTGAVQSSDAVAAQLLSFALSDRRRVTIAPAAEKLQVRLASLLPPRLLNALMRRVAPRPAVPTRASANPEVT